MVGFHLLADITLGHIPSDLSLHTSSPELLLEVLTHLITAGVHCEDRGVSFIQNFLLSSRSFGTTNRCLNQITPSLSSRKHESLFFARLARIWVIPSSSL